MMSRPSAPELGAALRRAAHPPLGEARFWVLQAIVVLIAGVHLFVDLHTPLETAEFAVGLPVAILILPVGYAAFRYGLAGSAATSIWANLLWLPDLLLPHGQGHPGSDLVNLALVDATAFFFGLVIEAERLAHRRVRIATAEHLAAEARYRQLFGTNRSPILVLDPTGSVSDANPAARALFGADVIGRPGLPLFEATPAPGEPDSQLLRLPDGRDYRVRRAPFSPDDSTPFSQVVFEDVTEERAEGRRASRYAQLVVQAEEHQRQRLARELHDEPLQLFLYLARRLETLKDAPGITPATAARLDEARHQAIEAAGRLRNLARDLRPPALDRLGFVAALSGLVDDAEEAGLATSLEVAGTETRLPPEVELGAFRIVQEAVRNTLRHSRARRLSVAIAFRDADLEIEVDDDGQGFDPEEIGEDGSTHLGLLGIHERARLLGGRVEVRSLPGHGTVVKALVPAPARAVR